MAQGTILAALSGSPGAGRTKIIPKPKTNPNTKNPIESIKSTDSAFALNYI
jgi:hypothetical protein